ncbi:hypothetical protein Anapl_02017 [Anas platyrhynchos]|uniref:Uncharacterized protein n=1 Tax=Anas platyrhynchos TaxID=8839 RepID=R0M082_ANAPL|nr:hypothetical protein Anapl_02017 [Anas platyrhynchos]
MSLTPIPNSQLPRTAASPSASAILQSSIPYKTLTLSAAESRLLSACTAAHGKISISPTEQKAVFCGESLTAETMQGPQSLGLPSFEAPALPGSPTALPAAWVLQTREHPVAFWFALKATSAGSPQRRPQPAPVQLLPSGITQGFDPAFREICSLALPRAGPCTAHKPRALPRSIPDAASHQQEAEPSYPPLLHSLQEGRTSTTLKTHNYHGYICLRGQTGLFQSGKPLPCPASCATLPVCWLQALTSDNGQPYGVAFPDEGASQFEIGKNEYLQHDPFLEASKTKLFTGTKDRDFAKMVILGIVILFHLHAVTETPPAFDWVWSPVVYLYSTVYTKQGLIVQTRGGERLFACAELSGAGYAEFTRDLQLLILKSD